MNDSGHRTYDEFRSMPPDQMAATAEQLLLTMQTRRTVRDFSPEPVDPDVIDNCLKIAALAPSGANQQPWTFVKIESAATRREIREAAEAEERTFYAHRAPQEWLDALRPFGTDDRKPFLEKAPVLIAIFVQATIVDSDGQKHKTYYATESVGIATGFLISALHQCGVATLTHTPSPMRFLNRILKRPDNERPFLLLVAGRPAADCRVPRIGKRPFEEVVVRA